MLHDDGPRMAGGLVDDAGCVGVEHVDGWCERTSFILRITVGAFLICAWNCSCVVFFSFSFLYSISVDFVFICVWVLVWVQGG